MPNWQKCPRCDGQGHTARPPWVPGDVPSWTASTAVSHPCPPCNGTGFVIAPAHEDEPSADEDDGWDVDWEESAKPEYAGTVGQDMTAELAALRARLAAAEARVAELEEALRVIASDPMKAKDAHAARYAAALLAAGDPTEERE